MSASYVIYGLRLTANLVLPGLALPLLPRVETLDLRIRLNDEWSFPSITALGENLYTSLETVQGGQPSLRMGLFPGREYFGFFYADGNRFAIDRHGREVWADWPGNHTLEDACTYLFGPVIGFVLRLRGTVCLHASAVAFEDRAIALVGSPGAGKSTTAAAFACSGFPVLSDDIVALSHEDGQWLVQPGYPRVNLWPDSARTLFGSGDALPRITPTWDKRYLPLGEKGHHFASNPLPLGAIYILDSRDPTLTVPVVEAVSSKDALITLVANTYVNYLLDQNMRRAEFDVLSRVVSAIPVRRVRLPDDPSAIFALSEAIAADARRVMAAVPANAVSVRG